MYCFDSRYAFFLLLFNCIAFEIPNFVAIYLFVSFEVSICAMTILCINEIFMRFSLVCVQTVRFDWFICYKKSSAAMSIVYIHFNSTQYLIDSWTSRFISFPRTTEHFNHYSAINCFVSIQKIKFLDKLYSKHDWIEFMKTCKCNNTCVLTVYACGFGYCCFSWLSIFINGNVVIKSNKIVILCKRGNSKWTDLFA